MFLCNEEEDLVYSLDNSCSDITYQVLLAISALMMVLFMIFLFIERLLFTSRNFDAKVPWATFDPQVPLFKIMMKLILACSLIFDKRGRIVGYVYVICSLILQLNTFKRFTTALIYKESVYYAAVCYDTFMMWLFLCVGAHTIS